MSVAINGTNGITYNDGTVQASAPVGTNLIINGDMRIDQRNSGSVTTPGNNIYTLDRWNAGLSQSSKYSVQQVVDAPSGFYNSIKATVLATVSLGATDYFMLKHKIEGYNVADLNFGTANPETITLSFWVKSSVTGTFGGGIQNSNESRGYAFNYTISSANTWEYKTVTLTGDTTGTWDKTNGTGLWLNLALGVGTTYSKSTGSWGSGPVLGATGATNLLATGSATIQFTGVQLEAGTTATPFENLQYGQQLALCQRYFYIVDAYLGGSANYPSIGAGYNVSTTEARISIQYPVMMRAKPTLSQTGILFLLNSSGSGLTVTSISTNYGNAMSSMVAFGVASGLTQGHGTLLITNNASGQTFQANAEL